MDQFSRKFDMQNYLNAMEIAGELKIKPPRVHTWELLDGSFSFPRVRRYNDVQENMDMIEHFQDNLNTNISNLKNVQNFIRVGKTVVGELSEKYHDGEFSDPAGYDPRNPAEVTWATADIWAVWSQWTYPRMIGPITTSKSIHNLLDYKQFAWLY